MFHNIYYQHADCLTCALDTSNVHANGKSSNAKLITFAMQIYSWMSSTEETHRTRMQNWCAYWIAHSIQLITYQHCKNSHILTSSRMHSRIFCCCYVIPCVLLACCGQCQCLCSVFNLNDFCWRRNWNLQWHATHWDCIIGTHNTNECFSCWNAWSRNGIQHLLRWSSTQTKEIWIENPPLPLSHKNHK